MTSVLIALLAAGMAAQAVRFLQAAGVVTALRDKIWDTSWLLSDSSIVGRMLHVLVGYTARRRLSSLSLMFLRSRPCLS